MEQTRAIPIAGWSHIPERLRHPEAIAVESSEPGRDVLAWYPYGPPVAYTSERMSILQWRTRTIERAHIASHVHWDGAPCQPDDDEWRQYATRLRQGGALLCGASVLGDVLRISWQAADGCVLTWHIKSRYASSRERRRNHLRRPGPNGTR